MFADGALGTIAAAKSTPLLVGGTGLYFRSLEQGVADLPKSDPVIRSRLTEQLNAEGSAVLHARLRHIDPQSAARIHANDPQRLVRALEVFEITGKPLTELWRSRQGVAFAGTVVKLALVPTERSALHAKVKDRFAEMLERGLVNEVADLLNNGQLEAESPAMRSVGYRSVVEYLNGRVSRAELLDDGASATRQLIKRQITWLRREKAVEWFDSEDPKTSDKVLSLLAQTLFKH